MNYTKKTMLFSFLIAIGIIVSSSIVSATWMYDPECVTPLASNNDVDSLEECCPTALTEYGNFYVYFENDNCLPADGLNNRLNELQWCENYILYSNGATMPDYDHYVPQSICDPLDIDPYGFSRCMVSCDNLYDSCQDNCFDVLLPNGEGQTDFDNCLGDCVDDVYQPCIDGCFADYELDPANCFASGKDYLGWALEKIQDIMQNNPPTGISHACELLFPEYAGGGVESPYFKYVYDDSGNLVKAYDPYKLIEQNKYSIPFRPGLAYASASADSGINNFALSTVNNFGSVLKSRDPAGNKFENIYDDRQRLTESKAYCAWGSWCYDNDPYETVTYSYDVYMDGTSCGNNRICEVKQHNDFENRDVTDTKFFYDGKGRIVRQVETIYHPENYQREFVQEWGYDSVDNLVLYRDPGGRETVYEYNNLGQLEDIRFYENLLLNPGFEDGGEHWSLTSTNNVVDNYLNAHSGNMYAIRDQYKPQQTIPVDRFESGKNYAVGFWAKRLNDDPVLRVELQIKNANGSNDDRPVYCTFNDLTTDWKYYYCTSNTPFVFDSDDVSVVLAIWRSESGYTSEMLAAVDDVAVFRQDLVGSAHFEYNPTGTVDWRQLGDDIYTDYEYNTREFLKSVYTFTGDFYDEPETDIFKRSYDYDAVGNIEKIGYNLNVFAGGTVNEQFVYDALDRLKNATYQNQESSSYNRIYDYTYDLAGNRKTEKVGGSTSTYNYNVYQNNRLNTITNPSWNFEYDTNGNIVEMSKPLVGTFYFTYDPLGRLVKVSKDEQDNVLAKYVYDTNNQRIMKIVPGATTYYFYQGTDVVYEEYAADPVCSDGFVTAEIGEQCDDGNTQSGDGCSATCQIEQGFYCSGEPTVCDKACGDLVIDPEQGENCEDGNVESGDGCSDFCVQEPGWWCPDIGKPCTLDCGDKHTGECDGYSYCDNGNLVERCWVCGCAPPATCQTVNVGKSKTMQCVGGVSDGSDIDVNLPADNIAR